jgi:hypothetical protein
LMGAAVIAAAWLKHSLSVMAINSIALHLVCTAVRCAAAAAAVPCRVLAASARVPSLDVLTQLHRGLHGCLCELQSMVMYGQCIVPREIVSKSMHCQPFVEYLSHCCYRLLCCGCHIKISLSRKHTISTWALFGLTQWQHLGWVSGVKGLQVWWM